MAIVESDVHTNLNRDRMFKEAWWLDYFFICGEAIGAFGNPFFGSETRDLCLHSKCQLTGIGDPFFSGFDVNICVTQQCAFPAVEGSPTFVCFNMKLAGADNVDKWKVSLFDYESQWADTFWFSYLLCGGYGFHAPFANGRPIWGYDEKKLCIKRSGKCVAPVQDGVFCTSVSTSLCFWKHYQLPPAPGNPGFKIFNFPSGNGASLMGYGKEPGQQTMASE